MNLIKFERKEKEIPNVLTHISIAIDDNEFNIKEEVGLDERILHFNNKEELLNYIKDRV